MLDTSERTSPSRAAGPGIVLACALWALSVPGVVAQDADDGLLTDEVNTVEVARTFGQSVVGVRVAFSQPRGLPFAQQGAREGGGSGFIVDDEGHVITNYHVVAQALEEQSIEMLPEAEVSVIFPDDEGEEHPVRVLGANPDFDLALLELVDADGAPTVPPLDLGDSDLVEAGQKAIAIGSPFGLHATVTTGVVSAIERERPGLVGIEIPYIQTDAAINPGNSGGPLLDSSGRVIGINNAILASPGGPSAFVGVGFAVPANLLRESLGALREGGLSGFAAALAEIPERPRIGLSVPLTVSDYPEPLRAELGLPEHGLVVTNVSPGGPADRAGIQEATDAVVVGGQAFPVGGDIVTAVNGEPVRRVIDLQQVVLERDAGDVLTLTVSRQGEERTVDVALEVVSPG